jgi:hypothetical protein
MKTQQQELANFNEPFKEIEMLRRLGLREDEISYLVWLKTKESRRAHWK